MPQDYRQATVWFRAAADQGVAEAQFRLGLAYIGGIGVPQDYRQATDWLRKAADQGVADAQYQLGLAYINGKG